MEGINNSTSLYGAFSKYSLRSSGETVEIVAFDMKDNGARSDGDWVSFIDSDGKEHIKEPLNLLFDFMPCDRFTELHDKIANLFKDEYKIPSVDNTRIFDTAKELIAHKSFTIEDAIATAKELVSKVKEVEV